ncbi:MAG: hypothetical protein QOC97_625 [Chloroflexota bacterium]|nr:hypothetical protein [Chloroflexota bacterium]
MIDEIVDLRRQSPGPFALRRPLDRGRRGRWVVKENGILETNTPRLEVKPERFLRQRIAIRDSCFYEPLRSFTRDADIHEFAAKDRGSLLHAFGVAGICQRIAASREGFSNCAEECMFIS